MSHQTLSEHIRRYYAAQALDAGTVERLKRIAEYRGESPSEPALPARRRWGLRVLSATAALVAVLISVVSIDRLLGDRTQLEQSSTLAQAILREIALNHEQNLAVEFPASSYAELRERMVKLNFGLHRPNLPTGGHLRVLGGRYCSLQGQLAAQIKLEDERGRALTLYQARLVDKLEAVAEHEQNVDGLRVRLWREGNLLLALASSEP